MSWDILPKSNLQYFLTKLKGIFDNKVDKETGKGLFSGNYNDLTNKPTIPAAQVNSDWNASSGVAQILNKPTIPAEQIQSDWNQTTTTAKDYIKNKPTIPAAQVNSDWNASSGVAKILNKPTIPDTSTFMQKGVDYVTAGQKTGTTLGLKATAEGGYTTASGGFSHAEGNTTVASDLYAHAEGGSTTASRQAAHAEGFNTKATGYYSHAEGHNTIAAGNSQHAEGKFNVEDANSTYAHIIGGGTSDNARKNIFTVDWNGVARDGTANRLLPFKAVSEAEYAALSQAEKTNGTAYFRYEANGIMRQIQDNGSATSLTSGALPTGQTITSYLNSNLCYKDITATPSYSGAVEIPPGCRPGFISAWCRSDAANIFRRDDSYLTVWQNNAAQPYTSQLTIRILYTSITPISS